MRKRKNMVAQHLEKLIAGGIDSPIPIDGSAERAVLMRLEVLRQNMAAAQNREASLREKYKVEAAGVAHDLKTPIALIAGYAECLGEGMDDKDYLSLILEKTAAMNDAVLSLVHDAEREGGGGRDLRTAAHARSFFGSIFLRQKDYAGTKKIRLSVGRIPNVELFVDKAQIERVVQNLISNAVKFTPERGKIRVAAKVKSGMLCVSIADNGCGIAKENIGSIFDKFYKEDSSRPLLSSNGLGLYLVKEMLENHGGSIAVKSKKGKGSRFTFCLPVMSSGLERPSLTDKFERLPVATKILIITTFLPFFSSFYRFSRFFRTKHTGTLVVSFLAIPLFIFFWIGDVLSELSHNQLIIYAR